MKNGHDPIDDIFLSNLENLEVPVSDSIFENAFAKSNVEKNATSNFFKYWYFIPIIIILPVIFYFTAFSSDKKGYIANDLNNKNRINYTSQNKSELNKNLYADNTTSNLNHNEENSNHSLEKFNTQPNNQSINSKEKSSDNNRSKNEKTTNNIIQTNKNTIIEEQPISSNKAIISPSDNYLTENATFMNYPIKANITLELKCMNTLKLNSMVAETPECHWAPPPVIMSKFNSKQWSAEISYGKYYQITKLKSLNEENNPLVDSRNNALQKEFSSWDISALINFHYNRFIISGGLGYSSITENTNYGIYYTNPQQKNVAIYNGTPWDYTVNNEYYQIDTTQLWHYTYQVDSILHISDSIAYNEYDTLQVNIYDTINVTVYDTSDFSKLKARYSYFEFPIYTGFDINKGIWGYSVQFGVIPSLLIKQNGSLAYNSKEILLPDDVLPARKFYLSGSLRLLFYYYPADHFMVFFSTESKNSIINVVKPETGISQKWQNIGIRMGVRYFLK